MAWSDERVAVLKKMWLEGNSASEIAKEIGNVTRNAVIGKVHRLGLSNRDSNVSKAGVTEEKSIQLAAQYLSENKVIGWFNKGSESGPRALGNRSILANPSSKWMVEYINSEIKKREWYRPFAPSVLFEEQSKIFELDVYSPYMLITTNVKPEWKDKIPGVTHFDYTSRYQSVTKESNLKYYKLISEFGNRKLYLLT